MGWTKVEYPDQEINWAGRAISDINSHSTLDSEDVDKAYSIVNNFRAAHSYPLNTFQLRLRQVARRMDRDALVAQRIKRLSSIEDKLRRFPGMKLTQMQDIGGCRAVLSAVSQARMLFKDYKEVSRIKHKLVSEKDYITAPKPSGYRGIHLVYRYFSDKRVSHNGLKVELQFRTRDQHYWATAVETVGTMLRQALKSSTGETAWLRFFALAGSAMALREKTPPVPGTPEDERELLSQLGASAESLQVQNRLSAYGTALHALEDQSVRRNAHYFLVEVYPSEQRTSITGFPFSSLDEATSRYLEVEKGLKGSPGAEAVLVSVDSINALQAAYPSYFLDSKNFLGLLNALLKRGS